MKTILLSITLLLVFQTIQAQQFLLSAGIDDVQFQHGKISTLEDDSLSGSNQYNQLIVQPCLSFKVNVSKSPLRYFGIDVGYYATNVKQHLETPLDENNYYETYFTNPFKQALLGISFVNYMDVKKFRFGFHSGIRMQYRFKSEEETHNYKIDSPNYEVIYSSSTYVHSPSSRFYSAHLGQSIARKIMGEFYAEVGITEALTVWHRNGIYTSQQIINDDGKVSKHTYQANYNHVLTAFFSVSPFIRLNYFLNRSKK